MSDPPPAMTLWSITFRSLKIWILYPFIMNRTSLSPCQRRNINNLKYVQSSWIGGIITINIYMKIALKPSSLAVASSSLSSCSYQVMHSTFSMKYEPNGLSALSSDQPHQSFHSMMSLVLDLNIFECMKLPNFFQFEWIYPSLMLKPCRSGITITAYNSTMEYVMQLAHLFPCPDITLQLFISYEAWPVCGLE